MNKFYVRVIAIAALVVIMPVAMVGFVAIAAMTPALVTYAIVAVLVGKEDDRLLKAMTQDTVTKNGGNSE
jgi:uncharacterized membrane protein YjgN (DUF898 family)